MKAARRPIISALKSRGYSAQAATQSQQASLPKQDAKVSRLPNGAVVASLENYSPISRVAVFYNAGPRVESSATLGMNHILRTAGTLSTKGNTGFAISKNIQQIGSSLSVTSTREHVIYSVDCTRDTVNTAFEYLRDAASGPDFREWELPGLEKYIKFDLAVLEQNPQAQLMELLHSAAFRNTLGRSLYIPPSRINYYNCDQLQDFVNSNFTSGNMAVVGVGIDHDKLAQFAKKIPVSQGATQVEKAKYYGGDARLETTNPLTQVALVTEGVGLGSKDLLTVGVLQRVMGAGSFIKYGSNMASSKVSQAAAQGTSQPFAASCISASYSDGGLFGFHVVGQGADMDKILKSVVATFSNATKGGITDADVQRAKKQMKGALSMEFENSSSLVEDMGTQALLGGQVISLSEALAAVDKITTADVQGAAKKIINSGKPTMAAVGNLANTPYVDQLL